MCHHVVETAGRCTLVKQGEGLSLHNTGVGPSLEKLQARTGCRSLTAARLPAIHTKLHNRMVAQLQKHLDL